MSTKTASPVKSAKDIKNAKKETMKKENVERILKIPENVNIDISGTTVSVKGKLGELTKTFDNPRFASVTMEKSQDKIIIRGPIKRKFSAMSGTIEAHIKNMILGVTIGYKYTMKIFFTHFPISVAVKDKEVQIKNFLGERGLRTADIVGNVKIKIDKDQLSIAGINKESVGQTAANIETACRLTKRDRRIFQDGIFISTKSLESGE